MPLYHINQDKQVVQIKPASFLKEKDLQNLFEANMETLFGIRFIDSEFTTGDRQRGRIDTLGLDQDGHPTIIKYKKSSKENVINQGLFYMDWLVDHRGDFTLAAQKKLGGDADIDWSRPRLVLVAESFSEYDKYAVNRIGTNIELWTYRRYGNDLLFLEPIFVTSPQGNKGTITLRTKKVDEMDSQDEETEPPTYALEDHYARKNLVILELFEQLRERVLALGEEGEIIEKANKMYIGYSHGKNFCEVRIQSRKLVVWLDISPEELDDPFHMVRDVSEIGHYGTGASEVCVDKPEELERAMALIELSFLQTI